MITMELYIPEKNSGDDPVVALSVIPHLPSYQGNPEHRTDQHRHI
jgi:hypothetical protein